MCKTCSTVNIRIPNKLATILGNIFSQNNNSLQDIELAINETVEAYTSMSKDKVGALMVFERKTLLDDVLKTGTPLDAGISAELLKNLFWNNGKG